MFTRAIPVGTFRTNNSVYQLFQTDDGLYVEHVSSKTKVRLQEWVKPSRDPLFRDSKKPHDILNPKWFEPFLWKAIFEGDIQTSPIVSVELH